MKAFVSILVLGFVAAVNAQQQCLSLVSKIPTCAVKCIDDAASSAGCSDPTDLACQCKNTDKINAAALSCVLSSCGAQQGLQVQSAAAAVCQCVSSAGPAPATSSAAVSTSAAAVSVTSVASSKPAAVTSAASTLKSSSGAVAPYPVSQASDGQLQVGTASPSAVASATASASPAPFTGSAMTVGSSLVSVFSAAIAAIALL